MVYGGRASFFCLSFPDCLVFSNSGFHQFAHQSGSEPLAGHESDGSCAGVVFAEKSGQGFDDAGAHQVEGAVLAGGTHPHQDFALQPEGGQAIADAFPGLRGGGKDEPAEPLEFEPLVGGKFGQIVLQGGWLGGDRALL